jgi:hypothetical protein
VDQQRHEFLAQLLDTPEYQGLHATTLLNEAASTVAATAFAEQFAAQRQEDLKEQDDKKDKDNKKDKKDQDELDREMAKLRAVDRALAAAREEVAELQEAAAALGMGPGAPGSKARAIATLFRRVRPTATAPSRRWWRPAWRHSSPSTRTPSPASAKTPARRP